MTSRIPVVSSTTELQGTGVELGHTLDSYVTRVLHTARKASFVTEVSKF